MDYYEGLRAMKYERLHDCFAVQTKNGGRNRDACGNSIIEIANQNKELKNWLTFISEVICDDDTCGGTAFNERFTKDLKYMINEGLRGEECPINYYNAPRENE